jgi:alpha-N-arabinofuranosidase
MWCLGNEMVGPWQIGHPKTRNYERLAYETFKALNAFDSLIEKIVCSSSNDENPTFPEWEFEVMEKCYKSADYISMHKYFGNSSHDTLNYFAKIEQTERYNHAIIGVIDFIKAKKRAQNDIYICVDEWTVWYRRRAEEKSKSQKWDWPEAPELLVETYSFEAALLVGGLLYEFIRQSDHFKSARTAQLVNINARIRAERGGPGWRQTIYWPYQMVSLYGRGSALRAQVDVPTYDCPVGDDIYYLEVAAAHDDVAGTLAVFALNRHLTESVEFTMHMTGFKLGGVQMHKAMQDYDLDAVNSPSRLTPWQ